MIVKQNRIVVVIKKCAVLHGYKDHTIVDNFLGGAIQYPKEYKNFHKSIYIHFCSFMKGKFLK